MSSEDLLKTLQSEKLGRFSRSDLEKLRRTVEKLKHNTVRQLSTIQQMEDVVDSRIKKLDRLGLGFFERP